MFLYFDCIYIMKMETEAGAASSSQPTTGGAQTLAEVEAPKQPEVTKNEKKRTLIAEVRCGSTSRKSLRKRS